MTVAQPHHGSPSGHWIGDLGRVGSGRVGSGRSWVTLSDCQTVRYLFGSELTMGQWVMGHGSNE